MGWIAERKMRTGSALYEGGPKRKGPLKRIKVCLSGDHGVNLFGVDRVLLECGHTSCSYGGQRAICTKCKAGAPVDDLSDYGIEDPLRVAPNSFYLKNFTIEELKAWET